MYIQVYMMVFVHTWYTRASRREMCQNSGIRISASTSVKVFFDQDISANKPSPSASTN